MSRAAKIMFTMAWMTYAIFLALHCIELDKSGKSKRLVEPRPAFDWSDLNTDLRHFRPDAPRSSDGKYIEPIHR